MKNIEEIIKSGVLNINEIEQTRLQELNLQNAKTKKVLIIAGIVYFILAFLSVKMEADPMIFLSFV